MMRTAWLLLLLLHCVNCRDLLQLRARRLVAELASIEVLSRARAASSEHAALRAALHALSACAEPVVHGLANVRATAERDWYCSADLAAFRRPDVVRLIRARVCDGDVRRDDVAWREDAPVCGNATLQGLRNPVFLHFPKTGGEYVERLFDLMKNHSPAKERKLDDKSKALVFTVARDPLERLVSWFRFCVHGHRTHLPRPRRLCTAATVLLNTADSFRGAFSEWLPIALAGPMGDDDPADVERIRGTFTDFATLADGRFAADYVVRFSHFDDDLRALLCLLGAPFELPKAAVNSFNVDAIMPEANVTLVRALYRADWLSLFDVDALQLAERHFAADFVYE